jgi:hypothetical protein
VPDIKEVALVWQNKTSVACILQISQVFISLPKASQLQVLFVTDQYEAACE